MSETDPATLPQWKGHAVPWVARWTGQVYGRPAQVTTIEGRSNLFYEDGHEIRDEHHGILWIREGLTRNGDPEFAQVSAHRQRMAMRRRLCQICGGGLPDGVINWLMHPDQLEVRQDGSTLTQSPPTCDACIPLALKLCPALKKSHQIVKVLEYQLWGVSGLIVSVDEDRKVQQSRRNVLIQYGREGWNYGAVVAKQQVVELTKFVLP